MRLSVVIWKFQFSYACTSMNTLKTVVVVLILIPLFRGNGSATNFSRFYYWRSFKSLVSTVISVTVHSDIQRALFFPDILFSTLAT